MRRLATAATFAGLFVVGCGSSKGTSSIQAAPAGSQTSASAPPAPTTPTSGPLAHQPPIGRQPAPKRLVVIDLIRGTGPAAVNGQMLTVNYIGALASNGKVFDSSWRTGAPFPFQLGGNVIAGWNQGVVGMRVGGRRELVIPAALAYGSQGRPPTIPPNAPLVFVIDLLGAQ